MKTSAGILAYRQQGAALEVLLGHPGGPFWKKKDLGAWSIPKGEYELTEDPLRAAKREFKEETGMDISGKFIALNPIKQKSGKVVLAWAVETDLDTLAFSSNTFPLEWPPKSGKIIQVPEIDKLEWFSIPIARLKLIPAQLPLLDELLEKLQG